MTPSDFTNFPLGSVLQDYRAEIVARNVMVILNRTGNTWRELTWDEYSEQRMRDQEFTLDEKELFTKVIGYCKSPDTARLFSTAWAGRLTTDPPRI